MENTNFSSGISPTGDANWKIVEGKESYLQIGSSEKPIKIMVKKSLTKFDKVIAKLFSDPWERLNTDQGTVYVKTSSLTEKNITLKSLNAVVNKWVPSAKKKPIDKSMTTPQDAETTVVKPTEQTKPSLGGKAERVRKICEEKIASGDLKDLSHKTYKTQGKKWTLFRSGELLIQKGKLGKGTSKKATFAYDVIHEEDVAILTSSITSQSKRKIAEKEQETLELFKGSEHVVQLKKVSWIQKGEESEQKMIMELCNGGELESWLQGTENKQLTKHQKFKVALDAILGVDEIHKKNHIHSDLKPANLFIKIDPTQPKQISVKIGDLGAAYNLLELGSHRDVKRGRLGSPGYMAPRHIEQLLTSEVEKIIGQPLEIKPRTIIEKLADEKFELGLVLFQLFYPKEFLKLPWNGIVYTLFKNLGELEKLREDFDKGTNNDFLKEYESKKAEILNGIDAMKKSVDDFVKKKMDLVEKHDPIIVQQTILNMLSHASGDKTASGSDQTTSLEEEKEVFASLVESYPIK